VERYGEPILTILEVFECVMNTLLYVELDIGLCWLFRVLVLWDKYLFYFSVMTKYLVEDFVGCAVILGRFNVQS